MTLPRRMNHGITMAYICHPNAVARAMTCPNNGFHLATMKGEVVKLYDLILVILETVIMYIHDRKETKRVS